MGSRVDTLARRKILPQAEEISPQILGIESQITRLKIKPQKSPVLASAECYVS